MNGERAVARMIIRQIGWAASQPNVYVSEYDLFTLCSRFLHGYIAHTHSQTHMFTLISRPQSISASAKAKAHKKKTKHKRITHRERFGSWPPRCQIELSSSWSGRRNTGSRSTLSQPDKKQKKCVATQTHWSPVRVKCEFCAHRLVRTLVSRAPDWLTHIANPLATVRLCARASPLIHSKHCY